jgi:hypothetical protein
MSFGSSVQAIRTERQLEEKQLEVQLLESKFVELSAIAPRLEAKPPPKELERH